MIDQALDYAPAIAGWRDENLRAAVRKARGCPNFCLWDILRDNSGLDDASFMDVVERRLRQSRFLVLIIGDGIQENVEALASHSQPQAGLRVGLAFVDLSIWKFGGGLLVVPRIPLRTLLVEWGIVLFTPESGVQIQAPARIVSAVKGSPPKPYAASEPEFYDVQEQRRPGLVAQLPPS